MTAQAEARFLCDAMHGRLARDLRMLGLDAAYGRYASDDGLLRWAQRDARLLVTADVQLSERAPGILLIQGHDADEALREVLQRARVTPQPDRFLTRCLVDNADLRPATTEERVRLDVDEEATVACPVCERVYWDGSHVEEMRDRIRGLGLWASGDASG